MKCVCLVDVAGEQMRILVVGLRGLPGVEGGVERHAEELYPRLVRLGCRVDVAVRAPFHPAGKPSHWNGLLLRRFWSPTTGGLEALVHTLIVIVYAAFSRPDIVHIHAVGPAVATPLARLAGLRVVVTHHGPDYEREKWGWFAKRVLRLGEAVGMRYANGRIAISRTIGRLIESKYRKPADLIPNGVRPQVPRCSTRVLGELGIKPRRYVLQVSRFVPEKRQLDLIAAFASAALPGWHLVLVGSFDPGTDYGKRVLRSAGEADNVILTGFRTGLDLEELYSHAGMFVLPSSHEGLPIAILEALSYGLLTIASDIDANAEVALPSSQYFPLGDIEKLAERLRHGACSPMSDRDSREIRRVIGARYDWDRIAEQTLSVYQSAGKRGLVEG
ncbi:MAG: glycosyltransferase family 4 protein [Pseudomonadales bacterium]